MQFLDTLPPPASDTFRIALYRAQNQQLLAATQNQGRTGGKILTEKKFIPGEPRKEVINFDTQEQPRGSRVYFCMRAPSNRKKVTLPRQVIFIVYCLNWTHGRGGSKNHHFCRTFIHGLLYLQTN